MFVSLTSERSWFLCLCGGCRVLVMRRWSSHQVKCQSVVGKVTQYELTLSAPCAGPSGPVGASAQDLTEDEEAETVDEDVVDDIATEDDDDEAEVEDDENTELVSRWDAESLCFFVYLKC